MPKPTITEVFLYLWILAAIAFDVWIFETQGVEQTITYTLRRWAVNCPFILLLVGGLLYHLWGNKLQ